MTKHHSPPPFAPEPNPFQDAAYPIRIPEEAIEQQKILNGIVNARLDIAAMPRMKDEPPLVVGNIDMCKLRDLLFSIRDNQIYCPICRCPEFSPNELRSSHFEPCSVGEMCERMLALYPRPEVTVKWRK
jgi:hypothetical protein